MNKLTPFTRAITSDWQNQLRRSVRLYLALGSEPANAQELENYLRQTEDELVEYLLAGEPPTASARQQAQSILDMAQSALLGSESEVQLLLRELTTEQAMPPAQPGK